MVNASVRIPTRRQQICSVQFPFSHLSAAICDRFCKNDQQLGQSIRLVKSLVFDSHVEHQTRISCLTMRCGEVVYVKRHTTERIDFSPGIRCPLNRNAHSRIVEAPHAICESSLHSTTLRKAWCLKASERIHSRLKRR